MGGFLVITVSQPTFCCVGVGFVVEVALGRGNKMIYFWYSDQINILF